MPSFPLDPAAFPTKKLRWDDLCAIIQNQELDKLQRSIGQERFYRNYANSLKRNWISVYDFILCTKFGCETIPVVDFDAGTPPASSSFVKYQEKDCDGDLSLLPTIKTPPPGKKWGAKTPAPESPLDRINDTSRADNGIRRGSESDNTEKKILSRNDFPYFLEDGIDHWCLWKLGGDVTENDVETAIEELYRFRFGSSENGNANNDENDPIHNKDGGEKLDADADHNDGEDSFSYCDIMHWINPVHLKSLPDIDHAHFVCLRKYKHKAANN